MEEEERRANGNFKGTKKKGGTNTIKKTFGGAGGGKHVP